jgi:hypothetical protein
MTSPTTAISRTQEQSRATEREALQAVIAELATPIRAGRAGAIDVPRAIRLRVAGAAEVTPC